jgi:hypothetical protein
MGAGVAAVLAPAKSVVGAGAAVAWSTRKKLSDREVHEFVGVNGGGS